MGRPGLSGRRPGLPGRPQAGPEPGARGGFAAVRIAGASRIVEALRARGIHTDARGDVLRLGPAPYVTDDEIDRAIAELRSLA